jgi:hypothetical protein
MSPMKAMTRAGSQMAAYAESVSIIERTWDKIVGKLDSIFQSEE